MTEQFTCIKPRGQWWPSSRCGCDECDKQMKSWDWNAPYVFETEEKRDE